MHDRGDGPAYLEILAQIVDHMDWMIDRCRRDGMEVEISLTSSVLDWWRGRTYEIKINAAIQATLATVAS